MSRAVIPSFVSEPQVRFLQAVLEEIRDGQIQIPRFQRPFVWRRDQQVELLNSIRDGLPVGAIMVWRTHLATIACYDRIGPYPVKVPATERGVRQYLLDGVQRMTTLYSAFYPPEQGGSDAEEWEIKMAYVDLRSREFLWLDSDAEPPPEIMPLEVVFDSIKLSRFLRRLPERMTQEIEAAEQVAKAFREYKIPVIPIVGDDLDIATRTFQRINSQGTPMSLKHMVHALTWSSSFDLQSTIEELRADHLEPVGWSDLDEGRILDVCRLALGLHMFDRDVDELSTKLRQRPQVIVEAVRSIRLAAEFFAERCGIVTPDLVPYKEQLAVISDAFGVRNAPAEDRLAALRSWLWLTTYTELFSGSSHRRVSEAVADVRQLVISGAWRWPADRGFERRKLPPGLDLRTPRGRALAVRLAEQLQSDSRDRDAFQLLSERGQSAIQRMYYHIEPRLRGSPGNHFLIAKEKVGSLRHQLEALPPGETLRALCAKHLVTEAALGHLRARRFGELVAQRRMDLDALEDEFMQRLVAQHPPSTA
jgi:hypothetical protein